MATSVNRSRLVGSRPPGNAYRLEMEGRTLALLVGLLGLTGLVVFALGIVTGLGMRDPVTRVPVITQTLPTTQGAQPPTAEKLTFPKGLKTPTGEIEGLKKDQKQATSQTKAILEKASTQLELKEVKPGSQKSATILPKKQAIASKPPAQKERYTVQVFSSRKRERAQDLISMLKKKGFPAFINQYQGSNNQPWYRVRVGNTTRAQAEDLAQRLRTEAKLKAPRIIRQ